MPIKSELLKECIADAKAIQATALANAKAALEEAFAPKLKEMLSNKLSEEANMGEEEVAAPEGEVCASEEESVTEEEVNEILAELEGEVAPSPEAEVTAPDAAPVCPPVPAVTSAAPAPEVAPMAAPEAPAPAPVDEEEINIEELLSSLEESSEEEEEEEEEKKLDETVGDIEKAGTGKTATKITAKGGPVAKTYEEGTEEEGEKLDETVGDVEKAGTGKTTTKITAKGGTVAKVYENSEEEEEEGKEDIKEQLAEYKKACEFLRGQLNEVNLLNAKLLYTNKLFKGNALNNSQKMKIIEAFDLTKSIREVKLTYAAMNEAMNLGSGAQKKGHMIAEGLASKPMGTTKPNNEKIVISEVNDMASRFQTLAGIQKKK